jgi:hypothetical protein
MNRIESIGLTRSAGQPAIRRADQGIFFTPLSMSEKRHTVRPYAASHQRTPP